MIAKWKQIETYLKKLKKEDAPTVSIAKGGVDFNPTGLSKKKKKELDGRTTAYKLHRRKLEAQRGKRKLKAQSICGSFREELEVYKLKEDNVDILRDIVKRKQAKNIKLKDGNLKIDMTSANAIIKNLVDAPKNFMKDETRKKVMTIINKGNKSQFMKLTAMLFK